MPYKDRDTYLRKQREFYLRRKAKRFSTVGVNTTKIKVFPSTPQVRSSVQVSTKPSITQNRPSSIPGLKRTSIQPQHDKKPSMSKLLCDAMNVTSKIAAVGHSVVPHGRYRKMMDIPSDLLLKYGITRNGNVLSAGPGVDIQAVLRRLLA